MLKSRGCLIMLSLFSLLWGCGGGGLNLPNVVNPPNPQPPSPTISVRVTLNMNQVYEGEEVTCTAEVSPSVQQVINWKQEPSSPSGTFSPMSGSVVRWRSPMVERATSFSLIAYIVVQGKTYEGSASIVVLDRSEPPQEPPRISISYPTDDGRQNLVGEGTLLTILGRAQEGTYPLSKIQAIEGESVLQEWPISSSGDFRIDLEKFGSPGRKTLKLRAVDSQGLFGETQLPIINDNNQLDSAARGFLRKYSCSGDGGTIRFGNLQTGPYAMPVKVYINTVQQWKDLIEKACAFWSRYTGIQFELVVGSQAELPCIGIQDKTNKENSAVAGTIRAYSQDPHEITVVAINLYKGWLNLPTSIQIGTVAHELGHALLTASEVEDYGYRCIMWPIMGDVDQKVIPPTMQYAIKLLYQHDPAWQP